MADTCIFGTRGSGLALAQTAMAMEALLGVYPTLHVNRKIIRTVGDQRQDVPLAAVGAEGVFVKELEHALLAGDIDVAVHSLKDLPTQSDPGLTIAAYLPRADARDALVSREGFKLRELPDGAVIGTGSLRRRSQLALLNPSWRFEDIRGNLETRLAKLESGQYDALILACAGLDRLGQERRISERLSYTAMLPAPGQAAVALQVRANDTLTVQRVQALDHAPTRAAVEAERALLRTVEGGCQVPLGAHAELVGEHLILSAVLASVDGQTVVRGRMEGPMAKPVALGEALGADLLERGGKAILTQLRAPA